MSFTRSVAMQKSFRGSCGCQGVWLLGNITATAINLTSKIFMMYEHYWDWCCYVGVIAAAAAAGHRRRRRRSSSSSSPVPLGFRPKMHVRVRVS